MFNAAIRKYSPVPGAVEEVMQRRREGFLPSSITLNDLDLAAQAAGIGVGQAVQNIVKSWQQMSSSPEASGEQNQQVPSLPQGQQSQEREGEDSSGNSSARTNILKRWIVKLWVVSHELVDLNASWS